MLEISPWYFNKVSRILVVYKMIIILFFFLIFIRRHPKSIYFHKGSQQQQMTTATKWRRLSPKYETPWIPSWHSWNNSDRMGMRWIFIYPHQTTVTKTTASRSGWLSWILTTVNTLTRLGVNCQMGTWCPAVTARI